MIGTIIKIAVLAVVILIAINFISPDKASDITSSISDKTGINKDLIDNKLDTATQFVKDSSKTVTEIAKDKIEDN
ncbi:MAG: hypothetical protein U9O56_05915 [Campylobacterota bacterium]|nr:hypothetical protein [Campylobacterota bacterium]